MFIFSVGGVAAFSVELDNDNAELTFALRSSVAAIGTSDRKVWRHARCGRISGLLDTRCSIIQGISPVSGFLALQISGFKICIIIWRKLVRVTLLSGLDPNHQLYQPLLLEMHPLCPHDARHVDSGAKLKQRSPHNDAVNTAPAPTVHPQSS